MENRGNQDVVANFGGAFRGDAFFPSLYKNPGFQNSWITLRLEGTKSNRSAIGARIKVRVRKKVENCGTSTNKLDQVEVSAAAR